MNRRIQSVQFLGLVMKDLELEEADNNGVESVDHLVEYGRFPTGWLLTG